MLETISHFLSILHSDSGLRELIITGGFFGVSLIVFVETGLLFGFFLPGDSLLITAGIITATYGQNPEHPISLSLLLTVVTISAFLGDQLGYFLGKKTQKFIQHKPDSFFFKKKHFEKAHAFYEKYGARAVTFARFIPIFRTFVPFSAGVADMPYKTYLKFSALGCVLWIFSMILLGYYLGQTPLANELHKVILVVIFVSILPIIIAFIKKKIKKAP